MLIVLGSRTIRLPGGGQSYRTESDWMDTLPSIPWFLVDLVGIGWEWVVSQMDSKGVMQPKRGYRDVPVMGMHRYCVSKTKSKEMEGIGLEFQNQYAMR